MNVFFEKIKNLFSSVFVRTKKMVKLPQGEEFENWLGV